MRNALPLFPDARFANSDRVVHVLALEGGTAPSDAHDQPWRTLTLLLDFTGVPEHDQRAKQVGQSFRCTRYVTRAFLASRVADDLKDFCQSYQADQVASVVLLPDRAALTECALTTLRMVLATLRELSEWTFAVSAKPSTWGDCSEVAVHVECRAGGEFQDAAGIFDLLSVCTAPVLLGCVDVTDLVDALGSTAQATRVVRALWDDETLELRLLRSVDEQTLAHADVVVVVPLWTNARISDVVWLRKALLAHLRSDVSLVNAMTTGHFVGREVATGVVPVLLVATRK